MKNKATILIVLIFSASTCFAKEILTSRFNKDIVVDGFIADWTNQTVYANSDLKIMFSICNDNENVYLMIKTMDRTNQKNIRKYGLECWISTKGKKKHDVGFIFPYLDKKGSVPFQIMPDSPTELKLENASLLAYEKEDSRVQHNEISIKGLKGLKDSVYSVEKTDIEAVVKNEKGTLVLEFKIPLKKLNPISATDIFAIGVGIKENSNQVQTTYHDRDFNSPNMPRESSLNNLSLMPTDQRMNHDMPPQDKEKLKTNSFWFYATLSN